MSRPPSPALLNPDGDQSRCQHLFDLPPEVVERVGGAIVDTCGIQEALDLRVVCPTFDSIIQKALWELPTFDDVNDDSPEHLKRHYRMNPVFVRRLIESKLNHKTAPHRPTTAVILATKEFASNHASPAVRRLAQEVPKFLITAIINSADLFQIALGLKRLEKSERRAYSELELHRYMLIAAIYAGSDDAIRPMLRTGMKVFMNDSFGDPLRATVAVGNNPLLCTVVNELYNMELDSNAELKLGRHWAFALESAAASGSTQAMGVLLHVKDFYRSFWHMELARTTSIEAGQVEAFEVLWNADPRDPGHRSNVVWLETAVRCRCLPIFEKIMQKILGLPHDDRDLKCALEDAVRLGFVEAVELILPHMLEHPDKGLIFWAIRSWNDKIILLLVGSNIIREALVTHEMLAEAIAAAMDETPVAEGEPRRVKYCERLNKLFELLGLNIHIDAGETFLEALGKSYNQYQEDGTFAPLPLENASVADITHHLTEVIDSGNFDLFHAWALHFVSGHTPEHKQAWEACVKEAVRRNRPAITYCMLEICNDSMSLDEDMSEVIEIATLKILLERGATEWQKDDFLRTCMYDGRRSRWLLENGVEPRTGNRDTTTMSYAIRSAYPSMIQHLLRIGCEMKNGHLLHYAAMRPPIEEAVSASEWVLAYDYSPHYDTNVLDTRNTSWPNTVKGTALHLACHRVRLQIAYLLLQYGADVWAKDDDGKTPLDVVDEHDEDDHDWMDLEGLRELLQRHMALE